MKFTTLILCGIAALISLAAPAAALTPIAVPAAEETPMTDHIDRLAQQTNTRWRATTETIRGLDGPGSILRVGETIDLLAPPPRVAIEAGLRPVGDEVATNLDADNLKALLDEARGDRDRALAERDAARIKVKGLDAEVRRAGETISNLRAELTAARDGRAIAEAEVDQLRAELALRPPAPTLSEQLRQVAPPTLLAAVNSRRAEVGSEPFGGTGASKRARAWVLASAPELARTLVAEHMAGEAEKAEQARA